MLAELRQHLESILMYSPAFYPGDVFRKKVYQLSLLAFMVIMPMYGRYDFNVFLPFVSDRHSHCMVKLCGILDF